MRFVEESEGAFSAAQLAAAERELEEQKKEWELDRLRALREEEERRMRLADDDEKPLTFGREDAQNQVNSTAAKGGSKRLVSKRLIVPSRRNLRRRGGGRRRRRARELSSESENETTSTESDSDSESQDEDVVEDSLDEESSHTESQSQGDEGEEEEGEDGEGGGGEREESDEEEEAGEGNEDERTNSRDDSERGGGFSRRKGRLAGSGSCSRNHFDLNSPRTRSRGNVQINLWTLDVSPILPGVKPNFRRQRKKFHRAKSEETFSSPSSVDVCRKRGIRVGTNAKVSGQNARIEISRMEATETDRNSTKDKRDSKKDDRNLASPSIDSNGVEKRVTDSNAERSVDDHVDSTTPVAKTQSNQMRTSESTSDGVVASQDIKKEKNDEKIKNGTNLITVCSVQVTRCSHKMLSATYKKLEPEVNRNEDAENLDVNVNTRESRSPPSTVHPDASLKCPKETTTKSKSEFGASANSLCNNLRGKLVTAASKESDKSIESPSSRSVPLLRSKTLRNESPDTADMISKSVAVSRVSIAQRNCKTNVNTDEARDKDKDAVEDKDKNNCDEVNNDAESAISSIQKTGQKLISKSENPNALPQAAEKGANETVPNAPDFLTPLAKSEFNSTEPKCKIRKVESTIQRGVTTRSSKIPSTVNHLEESNARLMNDKVDLVSEINKNSSQTKTNQGTRKSDNSQHPIAEQSRITRSTSHSWTPPPPPPPISSDEATMQNSSKLTPRRRPDTPLPRPITRSVATVNFPVRIDTLPNRVEKYMTRNSKQYQDNGLLSPPMPFRRSRSIPLMKPDSKESPMTVVVPARRRPDTPRPNISLGHNNEQVPRVTRSGSLLNSTLSAKSASLPLSSPASALRTSAKRAPSTSNESENVTSLTSPSYEKPQRTAKVVAILTLDTRNNSNKISSSQSKSSINCETKIQDKELSASRLSDSVKEPEADHEGSDSSDVKSRRLRRETKRARTVSNLLEDEDGSNDVSDEDPSQKRSRSSQISLSSSSSVATTRSEKLKGTIS